MSIVPEGENVRKAIKWISDKKQYEPEDCGPIMSRQPRGLTFHQKTKNSLFVSFVAPKRPNYKNLLNIFSG